MLDNLLSLWESTGIAKFFDYDPWYFGKTLVMYVIVGVLVYLAVKKGFEPLLLLPDRDGHPACQSSGRESVPYGLVR